MPKARINLNSNVLRQPWVSTDDKGSSVVVGSFPGGDIKKMILSDERGRLYIEGNPYGYIPDFLIPHLRRVKGGSAVA